MSELAVRFRLGRLVWTLLVTAYFLFFFSNFLADAIPAQPLLPTVFAYLLVLWLSVEYYLGSPFFQSGLVEHSALLRGVFAFFVYPLLGYVAADFIWWRWTQIPAPWWAAGVPGLVVFGAGTYLRLATLFDLVRLGTPEAQADKRAATEKRLVAFRPQRLCRHPRYLATLVQLVGAALAFSSWGGLVLVGAVGLPLILLQARYEDRGLRKLLRQDSARYFKEVPFFWPRFKPGRPPA